MPIRLRLFAAFAEYIGTRELRIEHLPGMTCLDAWRKVQEAHPRVADIPAMFAVGEEYVPPETELSDGDSVLVFPPVSGGDRYIFDTTLSVERAMAAILHENGGGEAIFVGRVRRISKGKRIRHLFYECEPNMAEREIDRIIGEMNSRWPLLRVHVQHRIGKLEVGDIAVIIAVSAEHRAEAIDACRFGIDELKRRVPIWKKEISESGEEWVDSQHEDA